MKNAPPEVQESSGEARAREGIGEPPELRDQQAGGQGACHQQVATGPELQHQKEGPCAGAELQSVPHPPWNAGLPPPTRLFAFLPQKGPLTL